MKNLAILILLFVSTTLIAQDSLLQRYAESITSMELQNHIKTLSSDDYEGRGTGTPGQRLASKYLKNEFVQAGLNGPSKTGDPFYQEFFLKTGSEQMLEIICEGDTLSTLKNLSISGSIPPLNGRHELVFVGYGIDEELYSDYDDIDVKGKIVAFLAGEPKDKKGKYLLSDTFLPKYSDGGQTKSIVAGNKGAIFSLRIDPDQERVLKLVSMRNKYKVSEQMSLLEKTDGVNSVNDVMVHIGIDNASKLFHITIKDFERSMKKLNKGKSQTGLFNGSLRVNSWNNDNLIETENIVAYLEGTDLKDELVVVTAHFDHLGKRGDNIYHGADDNASGTAAVLEIAEAFSEMAKDGYRTRRSVLFMPVSGEERGLLGSKYYVQNPIFPIENTVAEINMDMIGRSDKSHQSDSNYVYVYVSESKDSRISKLTQNAVDQTGQTLIPEFKYREDLTSGMGGSDHASFEKLSVPVIYFYCGLHPDYHRPSDTWDKIEYDKYTQITRLVFFSTYNLATEEID